MELFRFHLSVRKADTGPDEWNRICHLKSVGFKKGPNLTMPLTWHSEC